MGWALRDGHSVVSGEHPVVHATLGLLNCTIAWLFLRRRPPQKLAPMRMNLLAMASIAVGGVGLSVGLPTMAPWQVIPFAGCGALAAFSLGALGRSFAVLPADRGVVTRGPYRWVRHPCYGAEWGMLAAAVVGAGWKVAVPALVASFVLLAARAWAEEQTLRQNATYRTYAERVPYRFLPGIY